MHDQLGIPNGIKDILSAIQQASFLVYELLKQQMTGHNGGYADTTNASGDVQLEVDIKADLIVQDCLKALPIVRQICSEEQEEPILCHQNAPYAIAYDPLDGSSLMGANLSVGGIFGIYEGEFLPQKLVGAVYVVYGMVLGMGFGSIYHKGVDYFVHNGQQSKTKEDISKAFVWQTNLFLNPKGKLNSPGGTQKHWPKEHRQLIEDFFEQGYRLRYSGGMVPDLHHLLVKGGGIFSYPALLDAPGGKLRMLFEVFPFALIFEQAGGGAITGRGEIGSTRILDLLPKHIHDTTPCFFGSKEEILRVSR